MAHPADDIWPVGEPLIWPALLTRFGQLESRHYEVLQLSGQSISVPLPLFTFDFTPLSDFGIPSRVYETCTITVD